MEKSFLISPTLSTVKTNQTVHAEMGWGSDSKEIAQIVKDQISNVFKDQFGQIMQEQISQLLKDQDPIAQRLVKFN